MTDRPIRFVADEAAVRRVGERLLARILPRPEWTHEPHLAVTVWLLRERPDIDAEREIGALFRGVTTTITATTPPSRSARSRAFAASWRAARPASR